jgi:hypothetical protein
LNICFGSGPVEQYWAQPTPVSNRPVATRPTATSPFSTAYTHQAPFPTACTALLLHHLSHPWFPTDCLPRSHPRAPPPPRLILYEIHRRGQVAIHFPLLVNHQRVLLLLAPLLYLSPRSSAPSATAGSRYCLLVPLHVVIDRGSP